jgi:hypothetical protein
MRYAGYSPAIVGLGQSVVRCGQRGGAVRVCIRLAERIGSIWADAEPQF